MDQVNISCGGGAGGVGGGGGRRVILIRRARYGRMQLGRCVQRNLGYIGCSADVRPLIDARCSARRQCNFSLPDSQLYATRPCPVDTTPYLEVAYDCLRGICPPVQRGIAMQKRYLPPR